MATEKGEDISISFHGKKCIHARQCVLSQPQVFKAWTKGQWIFPDNGHVEDIVVLAQSCPSGAIQYQRHDGGQDEPKPNVNVARVLENGPIAVKAEILIEGQSIGNRATLCRCGQSKNKPFCDGAHVAAGFVATGEIPIKAAEALAQRDGPLTVTAVPDGPLMVTGNLEILRGTGTKTTVTTKAALCRCGASANKPYCDGSHTKIGFQSS